MQQIKQLYQAALEREASGRAAFLADACAGDEALRREVESLLAYETQAAGFIETPAFKVAAEMFAEEKGQTFTGQQIGSYRVLAKIGAGGMGEVYLAKDARLGRKVALKVLPSRFTDDAERVGRFEQEARAASALNHPNIITIYEIGQVSTEAGGTHFIVTEFIEGHTLRQQIAGARMTLAATMDVAVQVASALTAAHAEGIVHRDIKPENVMVRPDGLVKVLDFGLAKLTESQPANVDTEAPTGVKVDTGTGIVMGTVRYMSPEQARGLKVDGRTDIFSLGVMLYELIAGQAPFTGTTTADLIAAILEREPLPLQRYLPEVPEALEWIVSKALRKDREERYQTVKDMLVDLKNLKQELEFEAKHQRSAKSKVSEGVKEHYLAASAQAVETMGEGAAPTGIAAPVHTTSSAEYLVTEIKRHKIGVIAALAVMIAAVVAAVYFTRSSQAIDSLAVLPFVNAGADPNTEYLSDGITESLISNLSQLPNLKVKSRSAVFRYKGKETDPQAVGRELDVRAVLTGKVTQRGDGLVLSVELVDARDSNQIWGEQYNRKLSDILQVQGEITSHITEKLRLRLTGADQQRLAQHSKGNPEAYRLYLKGRYYADRLTQEGFEKSIESINQAIAIDPNYALAYGGLAYCYFQATDLILPPKESIPKSREAAKRALALDDTLAEAHAGLASIHWQYDWDWTAAEKEFKRAIELSPNESGAHMSYGFYLTIMGRFDEAIAEGKRAQDLDPLDVSASLQMGVTLHFARRSDQAMEQARQTVKMDPNLWLAHIILGRTYERKGQLSDAIAEYQKARQIDDSTAEILMDLGRAYGVAGKKAEAQQVLAELKEPSKRRYVAPFHIAMVYIGLGEKDQAFAWLEKAYEARSWYMTWLKTAPELESLRSDPRFADLQRRVGFTP